MQLLSFFTRRIKNVQHNISESVVILEFDSWFSLTNFWASSSTAACRKNDAAHHDKDATDRNIDRINYNFLEERLVHG